MTETQHTFGVEEEYQLVDPDTGELRSRADDVLRVDWSGEIGGELQETMLEVDTPVCRTAGEVHEQLHRLRTQAEAVAAAEGLQVAAAGLHPFSRWEEQRLTDAERPRMLAERFGRVARDEHLFGMHVHVAVPRPEDRVPVLNAVAGYTPLLLALSCSSPFYEGEDTGYASYRTILVRRLPFSGPPPRFRSGKEYRTFVELLLRSGAIPDLRTVYWSVRISPRHPTVEFRTCDVCPRLVDAVAVAALARALVVAAMEKTLPDPLESPFGSGLDDLVRTQNEWRVAREGLDASLLAPGTPSGTIPLRDALARLVERLAPIAARLGDGEALEHLYTILDRGTAAARMREVMAEEGNLREVVAWVAGETRLGTGMDRRRAQRDGGT